uniref:Uncharacterized protein n=1 Tax=Anguilla anguilla TaxID=7936 RepID=A0A0E9VYV0_ANGAN
MQERAEERKSTQGVSCVRPLTPRAATTAAVCVQPGNSGMA